MSQSLRSGVASFRAEFYHLSGKPKELFPSRRDFYKIWLIEKEGILNLGDSVVHISEPALVFLHPLVPYTFEPLIEDRTGYWAIFTGEFLFEPARSQILQESS